MNVLPAQHRNHCQCLHHVYVVPMYVVVDNVSVRGMPHLILLTMYFKCVDSVEQCISNVLILLNNNVLLRWMLGYSRVDISIQCIRCENIFNLIWLKNIIT